MKYHLNSQHYNLNFGSHRYLKQCEHLEKMETDNCKEKEAHHGESLHLSPAVFKVFWTSPHVCGAGGSECNLIARDER